MKFAKATKHNSFLKMGIAGPPGSGKSYSALNIASHISQKGIFVIDAEAGAASKYADIFDFSVGELVFDENGKDIAKPYSPKSYMEAIKSAYESGECDVIIIDGITPEWNDAGGCLQWVDQITKNNDTRSAWKVVKPVHQQFINYILRVRCHVICTMLAKKEMIASKDDKGKPIGKKVTLDPIQQDDVPRVFDVFTLMQDREMTIDKTRCPALDEMTFYKPGKDVADILVEWLKGDPMPDRPEYVPEALVEPKPIQRIQEDVPTLSKLKERSEALYPGKWDTIKEKALGMAVEDGDINPGQAMKLHKALSHWESKQAVKSALQEQVAEVAQTA